MPHPPTVFDVLIVGNHPASHLAASILAQTASLKIAHATLPNPDPVPPVALLNPALFGLHPLLKPLKRKIPATPIHGIQFLNPEKSVESRSRGALTSLVLYKDVQTQIHKLAAGLPIQFLKPKALSILSFGDHVQLLLDNKPVSAKTLLMANPINPVPWEPTLLRIRADLSVKPSLYKESGSKSLLPLSLNLAGPNHHAFLYPGKSHLMLSVDIPARSTLSVPQLMGRWIEMLMHHQLLGAAPAWTPEQLVVRQYPSAGALSHNNVGNRTLQIGPAGGFYSTTGEDLYPNCWSAIFACEAIKKALRNNSTLQDSLNAFRTNWGAELGHYLRAPHENLNYLLPLIFHNPILAQRAAISLLKGPESEPG